jgi:type I restriction enzyme S subunit
MGKLRDVVEIIDGDRGVNYPQNHEFMSDGYCLFLNTKNVPSDSFSFDERMFISKDKDLKLRKGKLKRGDFVLTTRGTVGNFAFYSEKVPFDNIRINSGMVILRTIDEIIGKVFINFYLKSYFFSNQVLCLSSGSAQPQLPIRDLSVFEIFIPSKDVLEKFDSVVQPVFNNINNNVHQIQTLSKLRDTLLPKLMKGEIRVKI